MPTRQFFKLSVCSQMGTGELKFSALGLLFENEPLVYVKGFTGVFQLRSFW